MARQKSFNIANSNRKGKGGSFGKPDRDGNKKPFGKPFGKPQRDDDRKKFESKGKAKEFRNFDDNKRQEEGEEQLNITIGRNPVMEAMKAGRTVEKLFVLKGSTEGSIRKIIGMAKEKGIVIIETDAIKLSTLSNGNNHQGVAAIVTPYSYVEIEDLLAIAERKGEEPLIIILDEIQDPHNLGSILRSAEALGAHGVIIPKRRSVGLSPTVAKASAGAIEHVAVAKVSNLVQAIEKLKSKGLWIASAHMGGKPCYKENLKGPLAVVIGGEGEGVSKIIIDNSDYLVKIPMKGKITSLNASVAASVILYEIFKQRIEI